MMAAIAIGASGFTNTGKTRAQAVVMVPQAL